MIRKSVITNFRYLSMTVRTNFIMVYNPFMKYLRKIRKVITVHKKSRNYNCKEMFALIQYSVTSIE